jgi:hypothetical protein
VSELEDFRDITLARQDEAEAAMLNGDPSLRLAMWSRRDPVSLLGAWAQQDGMG